MIVRKSRHLKNKRGQAMIEMLITLFGFFTISFMIVQMGFGFGVANYFHYVTFMCSRAYYAARATEVEQKDAAVRVARRMLYSGGNETYKAIAKGEGTSNTDLNGLFVGKSPRVVFASPKSRDEAWEQGVRYRFKMKLNAMPIYKSASPELRAGLVLESETWLGREPTNEECRDFLEKVVTSRIKSQNKVLYDNGC